MMHPVSRSRPWTYELVRMGGAHAVAAIIIDSGQEAAHRMGLPAGRLNAASLVAS
jgi:hypothetical protein